MSVVKALTLGLTAMVAGANAASVCGPSNCYASGCTVPTNQIDFVLAFDDSGSMEDNIQEVYNGFSTFISQVKAKNFSPNFSLVSFGRGNLAEQNRNDPYNRRSGSTNNDSDGCYVHATLNEDITTRLSAITNDKNLNGYFENGLECLRSILGKNNVSTRNLKNVFTYNTRILASGKANPDYDSFKKKVVILASDEDSDMVFGTTSTAEYKAMYGAYGVPSSWYEASSSPYTKVYDYHYVTGLTSAQRSALMNEASTTATYLYNEGFWVFLAVDYSQGAITSKSSISGVQFQYGSGDNEVIGSNNLIDLDATAARALSRAKSYANSNSRISSYTWFTSSLQYQLASKGSLVRVVDVNDVGKFASTLFAAINDEISNCDTCYNYPCTNGYCQAPVYACDCAGVRTDSGKPQSSTDANGVCCLDSEKDCGGICNGPNTKDNCGQCLNKSTGLIAGSSSKADTCAQDCKGNYYLGSTTPPYVINICGVCVANTGNIDATCTSDCMGNPIPVGADPEYKADPNCGLCVLGGTNDDCVQDCKGKYFLRNHATKYAGKFDTYKITEAAMNELTYSAGVTDNCGDCVLCSDATTTSCTETSTTPYVTAVSTAGLDCCGQCLSDSNKEDCHQYTLGVPEAPFYGGCLSECYTETERAALQQKDDYTDVCGKCTTDVNADITYNCDGTPCCNGNCTTGSGNGNSVCTNPCDEVFYCSDDLQTPYCMPPVFSGTNTQDEYIERFCPECPADRVKGLCGKCVAPEDADKTDTDYIDSCGQCCPPNEAGTAYVCPDKICGYCISQLPDDVASSWRNCKSCSGECTTFCDGTYTSNATIQCDGTCNTETVSCVVCGDGVVEGEEECDNGDNNGNDGECDSTCLKVVNSNNNAAIIGGVVGGILGICLVAAVGGVLYHYAAKSGLLMKAGNTVDMGASNANPLYNDTTTTGSNPLYSAA